MDKGQLKDMVLRKAREAAKQGPGWAQESVVLREVREELSKGSAARSIDLPTQQAILDAWHDLFAEKKLGWGYDLDNPNSPFFHTL